MDERLMRLARLMPWGDGTRDNGLQYVMLVADAEAEIEKARREGWVKGLEISVHLKVIDAVVQQEREAIIKDLNTDYDLLHGWAREGRVAAIAIIRARGEGKPCNHAGGYLVFDAEGQGKCSKCGEPYPFKRRG